jgi:hypothetical protein
MPGNAVTKRAPRTGSGSAEVFSSSTAASTANGKAVPMNKRPHETSNGVPSNVAAAADASSTVPVTQMSKAARQAAAAAVHAFEALDAPQKPDYVARLAAENADLKAQV